MKKILCLALGMGCLLLGTVGAQGPAPDAGEPTRFDADLVFPSWSSTADDPDADPAVQGVVGVNDDTKFLLNYIPRLIDILLKFVAPLLFIMMVFSGIRFIYAGDQDEELTKSKQFFVYSLIGLGFIMLSYSIMKAIYFILSV